MIITKEIAGGFVYLAAIVSKHFKINFSPDPELLKVQRLIMDILGGLKTIKFWIEKEEDVKEEEFIKYVNAFSGLIGMLLLEIGYMKEEKKFLNFFGRNEVLAKSSSPISVKWKSILYGEEEELVKWGTPGGFVEKTSMKLDSVLCDFSNYETQLEDIRCSVPDIESSIPFSYKDEMRIKKLSDFHVSDFYELAMQDPVEFGNREFIPHTLAENLVAYANIITTRSEIGTSNGMPKNKGSLQHYVDKPGDNSNLPATR
jgi:hypothetical protein